MEDIKYTVTVTDTQGCPKAVNSNILIKVSQVYANTGPSDTSIVIDQPLHLNASGEFTYLWSPPNSVK